VVATDCALSATPCDDAARLPSKVIEALKRRDPDPELLWRFATNLRQLLRVSEQYTVGPIRSGTDSDKPILGQNRKASAEIRLRLATNVKRLRAARSFTQHELAERCQFSPGYLGDIERQALNVSLATLEALAAGLECLEIDLLMPTTKAGVSRDPHVA
jgi:DNA-binding Xre family transcriptional regulator